MEDMKEEAIQKSLKTALANKDVKKILNLVKNEKLDVNYRDISHDLETLLMKICFVDIPEVDMIEILEALWERESDTNLQDSVGRTALMHACIAGRSDITEFLLSKTDTRVVMFDFDGNSAIIPAIKSNNCNIVKQLLDSVGGVSLLSIYNSNGESPFSLASKLGNKGVIKLIESYQSKLIPHPDESKKKKKNKKNYQLPPTYSPRTAQQYSIKDELQMCTRDSSHLPLYSPVRGGSNSSKQTYIDDEALSLWLTSPNLARNNYKSQKENDRHGLPELNLPPIMTQNSPPKATQMRKKSRKKDRRGSASLPDLREINRGLVDSGDNTPTDGYDDLSNEDLSEEEVFIPIRYVSPRKKAFNNSLRKSVSEKTIILPDIHTPQNVVRTPNSKRSSSEEHLNKMSLLHKKLL